MLRYATLSNGEFLAKDQTVTGFANAEEDYADNAVRSMLARDKHVMPWRIEDEMRRLGANYVQAGLWRGFAVRDGNLATGQQNFSPLETADALGSGARRAKIEARPGAAAARMSWRLANRASAPRSCGWVTTMRLLRTAAIVALAALLAGASPAVPRLTLKEVSAALAKAAPGAPADFSGRDLSYLDLTGLDFKRANLRGATLFGADLTDANLSGAMLAEANLDRTVIIRANFAGASLAKATMMAAVAYASLDTSSGPAPNFAGADLSGAHIVARLGHANLRGAILTDAHLGFSVRELRVNLYSDLSGAELSGAKLVRADLRRVRLPFADLAHADLTGADLTRADLFHADLTGADLAGANLTDADIAETVLRPSASAAGSER